MNIKWTDIQYNILFKPMINIRDNASKFEQYLENDFPDKFNILPNLQNAPNSMPRMMANNSDGLSITISAENISLTQNIISENDTIDIESFVQKNLLIDSILKELEAKILFSGIILRGLVRVKENPVEYIKNKFLKVAPSSEIFDVQTKITFKLKEKYYVNLTLGNMRKNEEESYLAIELDINDRYRYNFRNKQSPYSEEEAIKNIKEILDNILKKHLEKFIEKGEFNVGQL